MQREEKGETDKGDRKCREKTGSAGKGEGERGKEV
jgi:hypothetical protein